VYACQKPPRKPDCVSFADFDYFWKLKDILIAKDAGTQVSSANKKYKAAMPEVRSRSMLIEKPSFLPVAQPMDVYGLRPPAVPTLVAGQSPSEWRAREFVPCSNRHFKIPISLESWDVLEPEERYSRQAYWLHNRNDLSSRYAKYSVDYIIYKIQRKEYDAAMRKYEEAVLKAEEEAKMARKAQRKVEKRKRIAALEGEQATEDKLKERKKRRKSGD
jgi:hypothetical protein